MNATATGKLVSGCGCCGPSGQGPFELPFPICPSDIYSVPTVTSSVYGCQEPTAPTTVTFPQFIAIGCPLQVGWDWYDHSQDYTVKGRHNLIYDPTHEEWRIQDGRFWVIFGVADCLYGNEWLPYGGDTCATWQPRSQGIPGGYYGGCCSPSMKPFGFAYMQFPTWVNAGSTSFWWSARGGFAFAWAPSVDCSGDAMMYNEEVICEEHCFAPWVPCGTVRSCDFPTDLTYQFNMVARKFSPFSPEDVYVNYGDFKCCPTSTYDPESYERDCNVGYRDPDYELIPNLSFSQHDYRASGGAPEFTCWVGDMDEGLFRGAGCYDTHYTWHDGNAINGW